MMSTPKKQRPPVPSSSRAPDQDGGSTTRQGTGGAKNPWVHTGHHWNLRVATYNVRSLLGDDRLIELEEELEGVEWDIIGLSEIRRRGEKFIELQSGHQFYYIGMDKKSLAGVGFIIHKKWTRYISEVKGVNERLAQITLKLNKKYSINIIQVYAPTTSHEDEEVDKLYEEINRLMKTSKVHYNLVIGDFNAKVGLKKDGEESVMGNFGSGDRNDRGDKLIDFAICNKLKIMNTFFKKSVSRRWTWKSPNGQTKNEIDIILKNKPNIIEDVKVLNRVNVGSDHRMLLCKIKVDTRLETETYEAKTQKSRSRKPESKERGVPN
jgi:hypothetical protein